MTKDKYNLFGRNKSFRADVPRVHLDIPRPAPKPQRTQKITYVAPLPRVSRLEPPENPRPDVTYVEPVIRPQITDSYFAPILPRINPEPRPVVRQAVIQTAVAPPVSKRPAVTYAVTYVATSTTEFFSATKALASKPRLRIPKTVLKEVVAAPEPLPGSREAKLRAFIKTHF